MFADLLDEVPRGPYEALLASGAGRVAAALYGLLPQAGGGLASYAFYRLGCAVRSAVVLGLIGAGGRDAPGAVALGVHTLGVLGRLAGEATEETDPRPRAALLAMGARPAGAWVFGVLPQAAGPVLASRIATFHWPAGTTVLVATVLLTLAVDLVSDRARRALR